MFFNFSSADFFAIMRGMHKSCQLVFQPSGRHIRIPYGTTLSEAAGRAGLVLRTPCGGAGTCGKCRVNIVKGNADAAPSAERLSKAALQQGWRLACRTPVTDDLVVNIPEETLFESTQRILMDDSGEEQIRRSPALQVKAFELTPPSQEDSRSDLCRLQEVLGEAVRIPATHVAVLPQFLRQHNWKGCALIYEAELVDLIACDGRPLGIAFDLGTTTVVGTLIDLQTGEALEVASGLNGQISDGDDVIARILTVRESPDKLEELRQQAISTLNTITETLCERAAVDEQRIYDITLAGNTTMQQLACGIDPSALGEVPFIHAFERPLRFRSTDLGLVSNPKARVFIFSQIGGFVGGDTVAAILSAGMDEGDERILLVDIGTNGEIALKANGRLMCTSAAAGPAFEGAHIKQGMRAATGAIDRVAFLDDQLSVSVIGDVPATGVCGTALIDAVAGMLEHGLMESTGRIMEASESAAPEALRTRLAGSENDAHFVLAEGNGSSGPVCIWQSDIRELQLAAGAIRAGIQCLLQLAGITQSDLDAVLLAGAFGNYIRRENAIRIGLLPDLPLQKVKFIGNAASLGAKLTLTNEEAREKAQAIAGKAEHIDLSTDPMFQMAFGMAMMFPE